MPRSLFCYWIISQTPFLGSIAALSRVPEGSVIWLAIWLFSFICFVNPGLKKIMGKKLLKLSPQSFAVFTCFFIAIICAVGLRDVDNINDYSGGITGNIELPNILILSSDGINNRNTSAFGYERETTPFIKALREKTLVSTNHFSNSAFTGASVISLLTGKLPATTQSSTNRIAYVVWIPMSTCREY